jgi:Uma2 family endonuclease
MTATLESAPPETVLPAAHRFTGTEYLKMYESGIFAPDQRSQLIRGDVYFMSAMGAEHYKAIKVLTRLLSERYATLAFVIPQCPIIVWDDSQPEPDFALVHLESTAHPAPARDVLLAVEVSDSSLKFDRAVKLPEYARSGIAETWILNLKERQLEIYRQPSGEKYLQLQILEGTTPATPLFAPDTALEWWTALEAATQEDPSANG